MYEYRAALISIHDGDTIWMAVDLGCGITLKMDTRLNGLDAAELATAPGKVALAFVQQWFTEHPGPYVVNTIKTKDGADKKEKYGRFLVASIASPDGHNLNSDLLSTGNAKPYSGGARTPGAPL